MSDLVDWGALDESTAAHQILTSYEGPIGGLPPDEELLDLCGTGHSLVDVGAGVGRNAFPLARRFCEVTCFDLPNMVGMAMALDPPFNVRFTTEWEDVTSRLWDVAVFSLVLQHLPVPLAHRYLHDLEPVVRRVVIVSRTYSDYDGVPMRPIIEQHYTLRYVREDDDHFWAEGAP